MQNTKYKPVQIPTEAHDRLKQYCSENGYKLSGFLEVLINKNCKSEAKKPVLKVEPVTHD